MKLAVQIPIIITLLIPSVTARSFAAEQPAQLEPIIINSSRIPTTQDFSITNTTVIDREFIENSQASSVTDVLRQQAGIHVQQNGSRGAIGSVFLRNTDPNFVAVFIDGIKVNDPTNSRGGSFDFSSIDINSVERIEIVKGAMSSMYGSDALSGVIYITTRPVADRPKSTVSVTAGSKGYGESSAQVQQRVGDTDVSLNIAYVDEGEQQEFSGFINRAANLSSNSYIGEGKKLSVRARYNESDASSLPDDSGGEEYAVIREAETRQIRESSLGFSFDYDLSPEQSMSFAANSFVHDERVDSPGVAPGVRDPFGIPANASGSQLTRHYFIWINNLEVSSDLQLSFGLDLQREDGESNNNLFGAYELERDNQGVFLEALYRYGNNLTTKLGVRHDKPEDFSSETTANVGLRYRVQQWVLTLSAGSGFKLPSFYALGNPVVGNPDLVPEESVFWEAGARQKINAGLEWHLNIYAYDFKNLVDFDSATFSLVNRSEVTSQGAEVGFQQQLGRADRVMLDVAYSKTNIIGTNTKLRNRPLWRATGQYLKKFSSALTGTLALVYVDEVYESSIATGDVKLDDYYLLNFSLNWQYSQAWNFAAAIENLADEKYQETVGTDSPGTTVRASATASF